MNFILDGIRQALQLLAHPDANLRSILKVTLELGVASTLIAMLLGVPAGVLLGLGRFRGRRLLLAITNAGLGLPPVVVGLVVSVLLFRDGPFGLFRLLYTVRGMVLAQVILSVPLVISLVSAAVSGVDANLLAQAWALNASRRQVAALVVREARVGVLVAAIAALGSSLSEVGAAVLVGGNIQGQTETAAGAVLTSVSAGEFGQGIAIGIILLGVIFLLAAGLTFAQHGTGSARRSLAVGGL